MTAQSSLSNARYQIPSWFLECNVKTAADLSAAPDQIVFCNCAGCKEKIADDYDSDADLADEKCPDEAGHDVEEDGVKELDDSCGSSLGKELCADKIRYSTFAKLRDMTAAALVTDRGGKLLRPEASAVVFRMEREETTTDWEYDDDSDRVEKTRITSESCMEPVWMGRAVERVAKALGVSLVALDLQDLEELGCEFYRQDKQAQRCDTSGDAAIPLASTSETPEGDAEARQDGSMISATSMEEGGNKYEEAQEAADIEKAEDLEDNNENASINQQQWEPDVCSLSAFFDHFFASRAERYAAAESWQRTQLVWTLLLDAVRDKLATERKASEILGGTPRPSAVIFHLTDYRSVDDILKRRVLARFAGKMQQRRKQGNAVVMIVSTQDDILEPERRLQRKIGATKATTMVARYVKMSDADLTIREQTYNGTINARALRHCLREYCAHIFPGDLLKVTADWACAERGKSLRGFGGTVWTSDDMDHIVTQIMGRAWLKPELRFSDIRAVLKRLGLYTPVEPGVQDAPACSEKAESEENDKSNTTSDTSKGTTGNTSEDTTDNTSEDTTSAEYISEVLRGLNLNSHEEKLTKCIVDPETLKTHWDDVIIDQGTKELMQQFVASHSLQFDCASELLRQALRIRGALLYGPPGTGKTHLSRAVATASGSRMLAVSYASLISRWAGESEKNIEAAFTLASKLHPCVLFIDEVDSLFGRRSSSDKSWERGQINQFLQQMDGLTQSDKAPLVLVATNRPWDLDEAFLRRLQHKVYLGLPNSEARARIFGLFLHQDDLDPTVDINGLAQVTEKYSGSDIKTFCAKAGLLWQTEQARVHALYKSVSDKFAMADKAPKKVRLGIDHFVKALDESQPSNSEDMAEELEKFSRKHNPSASASDRDPGIRFIYNSSTKGYDRFSVRALISRILVSEDVPNLNQGEPENEMQLQAWCQLDLHVHLVHCLHTRLAVLLFYSQRVLEHQMQLQAWSQIDFRTHLMHRLHTNLAVLLSCLYTYDHSLATLPQAALDSVGSTAAGSNLKPRQKSQKTARRNKSKLKESASAAKTATFCYTTLGKDEFRLLEIAPGEIDAPLVCNLKHASFQSVEWYCALSYTWGSPEPPFFIKCNGSDVRVTRSLHEALRQMRRMWCYVVVWADAICINQSDNSEKSRQVMRMSELYSKASRLFIWLGNPVTPSDADAVDTIYELSELASSIRIKSYESVGNEQIDLAWEEWARIDAISENDWRKLQDFFLMPWFSRVWVFQEVASVMAVSPRNIRVGYGDRFVEWGLVVRLMFSNRHSSDNPIKLRFHTPATMVAQLSMLSAQDQIQFHLPEDRNIEENVFEAFARSAPPAGRQMEDLYRKGESHTHVALVIDLCKLTTNEFNHSQLDLDRDAGLMVEGFNSIFSKEFQDICKEVYNRDDDTVVLDGLAESSFGWSLQCNSEEEWWLPGNPAFSNLRRNVGLIIAFSLKHNRGSSLINVGLKTATFSFMPSVLYRLWSYMELARRLEATDLRDKLYAFLSMFNSEVVDDPLLQVNYSLDVADVYINLTIYFLQRLICLDVLEFVNDMPTKQPRLANLPSWVIDLSSATDLELYGPGLYYNAGGTFKFGEGHFPMHVLQVRVSKNRRRLDLNAYFVSEVTELGFLPHHHRQNDHLTGDPDRDGDDNIKAAPSRTYGLALTLINTLGQSTRNWKDGNIENPARNDLPNSASSNLPSRVYLTGQSMYEIFWRCLVCDRLPYQIRDEQKAPTSQVERKAETERVYREYHTMIAKGPIPVGLGGLEPSGEDGVATSELFGSPDSTSNNGYVFSTDFERHARTRVFGVVADELIGWFPRRAQKGDMLAILPGARCPYVLRRAQRDASMDRNKDGNEDDAAQEPDQLSEWEVIGHAYVQGLMNDIVTPWKIDLTENGRELLGKLNASGEAPAVERICLV